MNKHDKTVLVTGSTSGIGEKTSLMFAEKGWKVICHYNSSEDKAFLLKKKIEELNSECLLIKADLTLKDEILKLKEFTEKYTVDSLVNNAGSYIVQKKFNDIQFEDLTDVFSLNTFAPFILSTNLLCKMKGNNFGRIVNISSIAAKYGGSQLSMHYGCSKIALEGITKTLAREGAPYNVLANTVRPGVIDTDFYNKFPKDMQKRINMIPAKRMGLPEEVAKIIYYLGSEENTFITNEIITVSGGE